ncbi:MAG: oligosaccharide flippase family protein [Gammaproteobacteria bacterium]|nr:oligosaccharide flippase family protein [Gammaproteobacteria bacterium]MDH5728609.1 oligosaccharide flippase family protein [Gammaproteobacteria bacterium]
MQNIYKKAINHTVLYGASGILRKIVGFLMLPIYTRYLTPEHYGVAELIMMVVVLVEVFLAMRMGQAIFRFYCLAEDDNEKRSVMSTAFFVTIVTSTIACICLALNADHATAFFLGDTKYADLLQLGAILLITQALEEYGFIYIRVHQRALLFFILSVIKLCISVSLNIYFIVFLDLSVNGIIYSACIASGTMAVFATGYCLYYSGFRFSMQQLKQLFLFSYPLWLAAGGAFYSESSVKYFLRVFSSLEDVGIFALAAQFASLLFVLVWSPFVTTWQGMRYEIYEMPNAKEVYRKIFLAVALLLSVAGLGLSLFSDTVIRLMADEAFWDAGKVVPIMTLAIILRYIAQFNNFGFLLKKKTGMLAKAAYLNAVIITIGFVVFIPVIGLYGAAVALIFGSLAQLTWIEIRSKSLYYMELPWFRFFVMTISWVACYCLSYLLPEQLLIGIIGRLAIVLLFLILVFVLPILSKEEKQQILVYAKKAYNKISKKLGMKQLKVS